jgi:hypothetical protein
MGVYEVALALAPFGKICRVRRTVRGRKYIAESCQTCSKKKAKKTLTVEVEATSKILQVNAIAVMIQRCIQLTVIEVVKVLKYNVFCPHLKKKTLQKSRICRIRRGKRERVGIRECGGCQLVFFFEGVLFL